MPRENWPQHTGCRCGGGSRRERQLVEQLASRSLSVALRHAQNRMESDLGQEAATTAGPVTLPGRFSGWKGATELARILGPGPPPPFGTPRQPFLYRMYEEGRQIPLYIGMVTKTSIAARVASHMRGLFARSGGLAGTPEVRAISAVSPADFERRRSEIAKLRILVAQSKRATRVKVQYGEVELPGGKRPDPKLLHAYEAALQVIERPHSYVGTVWTFEDDLLFTNG
jgi:hypothetical protein